ncbi:MAG: Rare lipoprotein A precursor [uncultured Solirubrobacteraceae bacterium]|uniref:Rare lipoprotein A n=1 Tax=uncultured Solirubrobacteraceae bacterium TaxID=1162706 RepID=A0A6J4SBY9_9ACTN|nr:MAG: Rare lipoprotein A precursor [uncultured Solirubrobacteraceae bacterium]
MRQKLTRPGGLAGAFLLASVATGAEAAPAQSQAPAPAVSPAPGGDAAPRIATASSRPAGRVGRRMTKRGRVTPAVAGRRMRLQVSSARGWRTVARTRTRAGGRYVLALRPGHAFSARARVVALAPGGRRATRGIGRLEVYRVAVASWYGPGLYGNPTGCGGTLTTASVGVAHKSLPCGTRVTLKHRGRRLRVPVIDRGPYVGNREYDLTSAVARRLGFSGHGGVLVTR